MDQSAEAHELVPLSPPVFHVLLALGSGAMHGYAIMQAFDDKTGGQGSILPGTLYATISRMVETGLIEELDEPPAGSTDRRRRYYRTTPFGRSVAEAESRRMARLLEVARSENLVAAGPGNAN